MEPVEKNPTLIEDVPARAKKRSFFRDVPWRWRDVLLVFALWLISSPLKWVIPERILFVFHWLWQPSMFLSEAWLIGYTLWAARHLRGALPGFPKMRSVLSELRWIPLLLPATFAVMIAVYCAATLVFGNIATPNEGWAPVVRWASRAEIIVFAILAIAVAPIAEELAFRGLLYNKLRQVLPAALALALQAVAFGLAHAPLGIEFACSTGAIALVIGLFYDWRKTLVAPILLHASVNVIGLAMITASVAAEADSPRLGVFLVGRGDGCVVTEVFPGTTADRAGLKSGDVITALDGNAVRNFAEVSAIIRRKRVGDEVTIEFTREGKSQRVEAVLTKPPPT